MASASNIHAAIAAVCPILGVSIGNESDRATWVADYAPNATDEQKAAALAVINSFDVATPTVPDNVTNYQARAALISAGLFDAVNTAMMARPANDQARNEWEYANNFFRNSPFIASLGPALGITDAQIDALFIQAAGVE